MGKLKIKKPKIQKNSIPAPLNVTNFTMEQISRQTGVRIESLKTYLNAREQEIKEQLIKESQEKLWKAEDYIAVANIMISLIAIKKTWGFKKSNQRFIENIEAATEYLEKVGIEAAYKEIKDEMELTFEFDSIDINKEFRFEAE
jgi:hypothetical protein